MKKSQRRGYAAERRKSRSHCGKHIGGPGKPDYKRGKIKGEVKNTKRPIDSGVIKKLSKKGIKEVDSKSGFTKPAIEEGKKRGMKLITRGKKKT